MYMEDAINRARHTVYENAGGPFGAVIVKNGEVISIASNTVLRDNDPTAHAEMEAIRKACENLGNESLEGCIVYTNCEPCPMCLSALHLAKVKEIYFANTREDAAEI